MHRRALRRCAAPCAHERSVSHSAGPRHVLGRFQSARRKAAGTRGPRHQPRSNPPCRRLCVQRERTGVRPHSGGLGESGRPHRHSIGGRRRVGMHGLFGRALHIDVTSGRSAYHDVEGSRLRKYVGGIGLGTTLLYDYAPAGVDPFSPANPLIFASAPLVGTGLTTTAKFAVVTKSPLTGLIADSLSSSHFALELKRLGIDALVITGQAASLVYVFIDGQNVEMRAAEHLS